MDNTSKEILKKELCAKLPHGIICKVFGSRTAKLDGIVNGRAYFGELDLRKFDGLVDLEYVKPYLRPMDSMSDNEENEYMASETYIEQQGYVPSINMFDWIDANGFDYRGLIDAGLALPAPPDIVKQYRENYERHIYDTMCDERMARERGEMNNLFNTEEQ